MQANLRACLVAVIVGVGLAAALAGPVGCGEGPQPQPAEGQAAPSTALDLLSYAPPGTYALVVADAASLRRSNVAMVVWCMIDELGFKQFGELPGGLFSTAFRPWRLFTDPFQPDAMGSFLCPLEGNGTRREFMCGVLRFAGDKGREFRDIMERSAEGVPHRTFKIDGLTASDHLFEELAAFADPRTLLWGSDEEAFRAILARYRSRGQAEIDGRLMSAVAPFLKHTLFGGRVRKGDESPAPEESRPLEFAFGVLFGGSLDAALAATYETEPEAQVMKVRASEYLDREADEKGWYVDDEDTPRAVRSIVLSAEGKTFHAELHMTLQQVQDMDANLVADELEHRLYARISHGRSRLHNVGIAMRMWRSQLNGDGEYPPDLQGLVNKGYIEDDEGISFTWSVDGLSSSPGRSLGESYKYVGWLPADTPPAVIIVYSRRMVYPYHRVVLSADGQVAWLSEDQLHDPAGDARTSLAASYRLLMERVGDQFGEEDKARLRRFYEIRE